MHRRRPFRVAVVTFLLAMAATSGGAVSARDGSISPGTTAAPSGVTASHLGTLEKGPRARGRMDEATNRTSSGPRIPRLASPLSAAAPSRQRGPSPLGRRSAPGRGHADGQPGRRQPARVRRVVAEQRAGHQRRASGSDPRRRTRSRHADPEQLVPDDRSRRQRPRRRVAERLRRLVRVRRSRFARVVRPPRHLRQPPRPLADGDGRPDLRRDRGLRLRDEGSSSSRPPTRRPDRLLDRVLLLQQRLPDGLPGARARPATSSRSRRTTSPWTGGCLSRERLLRGGGAGHRLGGLAWQ